MNVAIIGYGGLGKLHARNLAKINDFKLTAVCDINYVPQADSTYSHFGPAGTAGKPEFAVYEKSADMFKNEKIDVVINALPSYLHTDFNIEALENGCHVFTEKPFALTVKDCDAVIKAAKKAGKILMIGQCMRFWPGWKELKDYITDKRYGRLRYLSLRRIGGSPAATSWFMDGKKSGGVIMDLHIHDVDFANFLLGRPERISANSIYDKKKNLDIVSADFAYPNTLVHIESGWLGKAEFVMEFHAVFDTMVLRYAGGKLTAYDTETKKYTDVAIAPEGGHFAELAYFFECVKNSTAPRICMPADSRTSIELALMSRKSAALGKDIVPGK